MLATTDFNYRLVEFFFRKIFGKSLKKELVTDHFFIRRVCAKDISLIQNIIGKRRERLYSEHVFQPQINVRYSKESFFLRRIDVALFRIQIFSFIARQITLIFERSSSCNTK